MRLKRTTAYIGLLTFIFLASGCSSPTPAESDSVAKTEASAVTPSPEIQETIEAPEPPAEGFLNPKVYSEVELEEFEKAFNQLTISFDEFDEYYYSGTDTESQGWKSFVSAMSRNNQAGLVNLMLEYGPDLEPYMALGVFFTDDDWMYGDSLQLRANGETTNIDLSMGRDVMANAAILESGQSSPISEDSLELLLAAMADPDAKVRYGTFEWPISDSERQSFILHLDAFRHVVFKEHPALQEASQ
jgi:hypothetical protein